MRTLCYLLARLATLSRLKTTQTMISDQLKTETAVYSPAVPFVSQLRSEGGPSCFMSVLIASNIIENYTRLSCAESQTSYKKRASERLYSSS